MAQRGVGGCWGEWGRPRLCSGAGAAEGQAPWAPWGLLSVSRSRSGRQPWWVGANTKAEPYKTNTAPSQSCPLHWMPCTQRKAGEQGKNNRKKEGQDTMGWGGGQEEKTRMSPRIPFGPGPPASCTGLEWTPRSLPSTPSPRKSLRQTCK